MYSERNGTFTRSEQKARSGSKPSFSGGSRAPRGGSSFSGGSRGGSRPGGSRFGGSRGGGGRSGGFKQKSFSDVSKFINKVSVVEEAEVFVPEHISFNDFKIEDALKRNIIVKGYTAPSPIQDKIIPHVLNGQDVVGLANTGTGKTAAFLIPLIHRMLHDLKMKVLIVAPTRELAIQIQDELKGFTPGLDLYSVCAVGGAPIYPQVSALKRRHEFVIGTPGRIKDLIERKSLNLKDFNTVVLDEADRMLDMGFIADIKYMLALMPKPRHTLFFSATLGSDIEGLIAQFLTNPVKISVKTRDTSKSIDQDIIKLAPGQNKMEVLAGLLKDPEFDKVLIFGKTKHGVERLGKELVHMGFKAESIHGDKNHSRRQRALGLFKTDQVQVLVATDVAARGLDISDVSHVINYDLPSTYEDYVHRIGRTGRGGKSGKALTFIQG